MCAISWDKQVRHFRYQSLKESLIEGPQTNANLLCCLALVIGIKIPTAYLLDSQKQRLLLWGNNIYNKITANKVSLIKDDLLVFQKSLEQVISNLSLI
jgi:hypothetical protein